LGRKKDSFNGLTIFLGGMTKKLSPFLFIWKLICIFVKNKIMTTIVDKTGKKLQIHGNEINAMKKCISLNKGLTNNEWSLKDCHSLLPSEYEGFIEIWYHGFWRPGFG
jgi:hypothetical protein